MADPALIQTLKEVQTENYVSAAACALVIYDQVLTLSREIDHIWDRQWNFMTALYVVARYSGDLQVIASTAMYICINWTTSGYANIFIAASWGLIIFILAMQAILVIRVYALFNWSKKVLIFIATFYALQATGIFVMAAIFYNKQALREHVISVSPTIGSVAQNFTLNAPSELVNLNQAAVYLAVAFDIILLFFALWAFVRHALEAKTLDGKWSINVLMRTLVADHLMYFIFNLTWLSLDLSSYFSSASELLNPLLAGMLSISSALAVIAGPHMMISLRETEKKMRGEGGTVAGEVSTVRFGARESESGMEEGEGFQATDEHNE